MFKISWTDSLEATYKNYALEKIKEIETSDELKPCETWCDEIEFNNRLLALKNKIMEFDDTIKNYAEFDAVKNIANNFYEDMHKLQKKFSEDNEAMGNVIKETQQENRKM